MTSFLQADATRSINRTYSFFHNGKVVTFGHGIDGDYICDFHRRGCFYELATLERLSRVIPRRATIIDVGANVGNHSVYFSMFCDAERVIPIEANPVLCEVLRSNAALNNITCIDEKYLRLAVSDVAAESTFIVENGANWGNGRIIEDAALARCDPDRVAYLSTVQSIRIDDLDIGRAHFIKIDVEGHEINVIRGAEETISSFRPVIFVEAGLGQIGAVSDALRRHSYVLIDVIIDYPDVYNMLFVRGR